MEDDHMMKRVVTADELLAKQYELGSDLTAQQGFHMWGPQVWASTCLENLTVEEKDIPYANLLQHIKVSIMKTGDDVLAIGNRLTNERETLLKLPNERRKVGREALCKKQQLDNMKKVASVLKRIEERSSLGMLTLDSLLRSFLNLWRMYPDEYKLYNLSRIACSYAVPLFMKIFKGWDPLQNPIHGQKEVSAWKTMLKMEDSANSCEDLSSLYSRLIMAFVYPAVEISGTNSWTEKDPQKMLRFLESWEKVLPPLVIQKILDDVVTPKISLAVDSWDPHTETIDEVHSWILPWQHLLGDRLGPWLNTIHGRGPRGGI